MPQQSPFRVGLLAAHRVAVQVLHQAGADERVVGERAPEFMPPLPSADIYQQQFDTWVKQMEPGRYSAWFKRQMEALKPSQPPSTSKQ